jgi:hypothetical protein
VLTGGKREDDKGGQSGTERGKKAFYLEGVEKSHLTDRRVIRYIVYEMINA